MRTLSDSSITRLAGRAPLIAVCGTSQANDDEHRIAETVGLLCAERGAVVVCGGLGGVMESSAKGAMLGGGTSIGFLPGGDADEANEYLTFAIPTGLGEMRNGVIARSCAGMIAIGGGYGTLSEIGFMRRLDRPVTCIDSWQISQPGEMRPDPGIHWATSVDDAVDWLWEKLGLNVKH